MARLATLEKRIVYDVHGKALWQMRLQPWHAVHWTAGIALPPHERFLLRIFFANYKENNIVASRGTSKTFSIASLAAPIKSMLFKGMNILGLSASGFRGGKEVLRDSERLFLGTLKSQQKPGDYLLSSTTSGQRVLSKDPSMWAIELRSHSRYATVPTTNDDMMRGLRTNVAVIDERNTFPGEVVQKVIRPMMNVGMDFRRTASAGDGNQIFQISTIDFTVRDWYPELQVAQKLARRQYEAAKAMKEGDWDEYDRLMEEDNGALRTASFSYTRLDYTDLIIPERFPSMDGETAYRVEYPLEPGVEREAVLKYDEREQANFFYTYPVDKAGLEEPLLQGVVDHDIWLAENRNVFIAASGNVFPFDLIQRISERPVWSSKEGVRRRRKSEFEDDENEFEFYAPVMISCGDPCVLGMDVARESDMTTFVVIRLGELAEGPFDPFGERFDDQGRPLLGQTTWNHICWAEEHRHMPAHDAAKKVRELKQRYNIIATHLIGGIAMDKRGGGSAVRDDLGNPKPDVIDGVVDPTFDWEKTLKIFDPEDDDGFAHYKGRDGTDPLQYWGGLRLITATNHDNVDWTFGARAMMQQRKLYIGYFRPASRWAREKGLITPNGEPDREHPDYKAWSLGYNGIRKLKSQLMRLQSQVSVTGVMRFVMPGNREREEGKKDLWAAMIYGFSLARAHLLSQTNQKKGPPMVEPVVIQASDPFGALSTFKGFWDIGN